jgi:hypothetical protein
MEMFKKCPCGSGECRWEIKDGHGIFLAFACSRCEDKKMHFIEMNYRPDIFEPYDADEFIEED